MTDAFKIIVDALPTLLVGAVGTIQATIMVLILALMIGLSVGLCRISGKGYLRLPASSFIHVIRGTPILIQILFIYFGLPAAFQIKLPAIVAGIAAHSIHAGAYLAEIFRAGIESIDRGQMEAGRSLGFTHVQTMRLVILPQAIRRMIPAFMNQFTTILKETSLLSVIGISELTMKGETIYSYNFRAFEILTAVGTIYFMMNYTVTKISLWVERRLAHT